MKAAAVEIISGNPPAVEVHYATYSTSIETMTPIHKHCYWILLSVHRDCDTTYCSVFPKLSRMVTLMQFMTGIDSVTQDKHPYLPYMVTYRRNIHEIVTLTQSVNEYPVVLTMPYKPSAHNEDSLIDQFNELSRSVALKTGALLIDFDRKMTGNHEYFIDIVHVTPEGNKIKAQMLYDALLPAVRSKVQQRETVFQGSETTYDQ